jgi:serine/threonine protein kinase
LARSAKRLKVNFRSKAEMTSNFSPNDISFSHVADFFLARRRRGEAPLLEHLVKAFPHLEEVIREQLPSLELIETAISARDPKTGVGFDSNIGGCEIVREIGRGASGIVYEANQQAIGRKVAVKIISIESRENPVALERFELESQAMGRLEHSHIVPVYSYGQTETHAFLVMKYIEGLSLYDLQSGKGDFRVRAFMAELHEHWHALAELASNLASGLHHAHEQGIVHRDVKPANLILDSNGKCWITDFGLAKIFDSSHSLSRAGDAIGTLRYMAPEQLRGACDARSDIYSLGITLYELATGHRVWEQESPTALLTQRDSLSLPDLAGIRPDLPANLSKIIMKACNPSPADRYQTAKELSIVLERLLGGATVGDRRRRKRVSDALHRKRSRRKKALMLMAGSVLFPGGVFVYDSIDRNNQTTATSLVGLEVENVSLGAEPKEKAAVKNLINQIADGDARGLVKSFVKSSAGITDPELTISDSANQEILQQIDALTEDAVNQFVEKYKRSPLATATRIVRLNILIDKSGLSRTDQHKAKQVIESYALAVASKRASFEDAEQLISSYLGTADMIHENFRSFDIRDEELAELIAHCKSRAEPFLQSEANYSEVVDSLRVELEGKTDNAAMNDSSEGYRRPRLNKFYQRTSK